MNKIEKIIVSMLVIAMLAFSTGALISTVAAAGAASYSALPWASNNLVTPGTLTIYGSSTVGPIATEEIGEGNFVSYFNGLISAGTISSSQITGGVTLYTQGSGTAIPALAESTGSADVGEMSRPPSTGEFSTASMTSMQQYCVGVDSVAIVVDPTMTWFPTDLTTAQVAQLFADNSPATTTDQGIQGNNGATPLYQTWGAFLDAYYGGAANVPASVPTAVLTENINRAVRDPTSGTFDCFNNYFAVPNGYSFEHKTSGSVDASAEMAPYTYDQENIGIFDTVKAGNPTSGDYIGFISLGYLNTYGGNGANMIGINIAYNTAATPSGGTNGSPLIAYYGTSGTYAFVGSTVNPPVWGSYVTPTNANVIYSYSGIQGSQATGQYDAWRWLWEVVPGPIPASGPCLAAGVWIAYMMADGTTNAATTSTPGTLATTVGSGNSDFALDNNYIALERDDMAGGQVLNSVLAAQTPLAGQTQSYPTGVVNFHDITYFVGNYINYYTNGVYNPYCDQNADGVINFHDISLFVANYIAYYTTWNPI